MTIKDTIINAILLVRYKFFKSYIKPKNFGVPTFESNFITDKYNISNGYYYSSNMVTNREEVKVKEGILNLYARPYNKNFTDWSGLTKFIEWSIGWVDFSNIVEGKWGIWSATLKLPKDASSAFWLLRKRHWSEKTLKQFTVNKIEDRKIFLNEKFVRIDYNWFVLLNKQFIGYVYGYNIEENSIVLDRDITSDISVIEIGPDHIIPEVDIMEMMQKDNKSVLKNTIHYGYELEKYTTTSGGPWICKTDELWHNYAVDVNPKGYYFYIDNVLVGVFTNRKSIENIEAYPIFNNAVYPNRKQEELILQIKDFKYYEKKY